MATTTRALRSVHLPSGWILVAAVYVVCVGGLDAVFIVDIVVSDEDPYRSEGPIASMIAVTVFGTAALGIGTGLVLWLRRTPSGARVGAFLLVGLSVSTIIFFWSGAPGILGACAAWCAGLTKGGRPLGGGARAAGIVGAFIALLNVVLTVGGVLVPS